MPGLLKPSARCPCCGVPLLGLADLTTSTSVTREYFHEKEGPERRRSKCTKRFSDLKAAANERSGLEVHCALPSTGRRGQYHPN
jgi:hypothetical protein